LSLLSIAVFELAKIQHLVITISEATNLSK
jgi:hypothetical protein